MVALLGACSPDDGERDTSDRKPPPDTAAPDLETCPLQPCIAELAVATRTGSHTELELGAALAVSGSTVVAGAPYPGPYGFVSEVWLLTLPDLEVDRVWTSEADNSLMGSAVGLSDPDEDGTLDIAVGCVGCDFVSAAFLVPADATGSLPSAASLSLEGGNQDAVGRDVDFGAVGAGPETLLVVSAGGFFGQTDGGVYAVDPRLTGTLETADAELSIQGPAGFGAQTSLWDADGDGQLDLTTRSSGEAGGVALFLGPWVGDRTEADAEAEWTGGAPEFDYGDHTAPVGDITGDGLDDCAFAAGLWGDDPYRAGRAYITPGNASGAWDSGPADELEIQVRGTSEGEGMGYGLSGADIDGDGTQDLVVGATGVYPGAVPGVVLVFPGPVTGTLSADDAEYRVYGEHPYDGLGRGIAPADVDGDAQADLVLSAPNWPGGRSEGAVYVLLGADLAP